MAVTWTAAGRPMSRNLLRLVGHTLVSSVGARADRCADRVHRGWLLLAGLDRLDLAALADAFDVGARASPDRALHSG
jgi:IMP cyclohydrolase